jgi:hypothetical protein
MCFICRRSNQNANGKMRHDMIHDATKISYILIFDCGNNWTYFPKHFFVKTNIDIWYFHFWVFDFHIKLHSQIVGKFQNYHTDNPISANLSDLNFEWIVCWIGWQWKIALVKSQKRSNLSWGLKMYEISPSPLWLIFFARNPNTSICELENQKSKK